MGIVQNFASNWYDNIHTHLFIYNYIGPGQGLRYKDQDKDSSFKDKDQDKDLRYKDQDQDKDLKFVLKDNKDKDFKDKDTSLTITN